MVFIVLEDEDSDMIFKICPVVIVYNDRVYLGYAEKVRMITP
jgi:hypothetical protein